MKTILSKLLILTVLLLLASLPSCVKQPAPKPTPGKDQEQEDDDKDDNKPVVETDPARLKFLSFSFAPEHNGQIYSEVALTASGNTLSGDILYYRTDLTQLAASFETNGAKVTVGSTEQKSGVTVNDFTKAIAYRIYTPAGQFREFKVTVRNHSYSGLPLLVLSTEGAAPVSSKVRCASTGRRTTATSFPDRSKSRGAATTAGRKTKSPMRSSSPRNNRLWA